MFGANGIHQGGWRFLSLPVTSRDQRLTNHESVSSFLLVLAEAFHVGEMLSLFIPFSLLPFPSDSLWTSENFFGSYRTIRVSFFFFFKLGFAKTLL